MRWRRDRLGVGMAWDWLPVFLALATGGVVVAVMAVDGPGLGARRFDPAGGASSARPVDQWRALDRGEDPTR